MTKLYMARTEENVEMYHEIMRAINITRAEVEQALGIVDEYELQVSAKDAHSSIMAEAYSKSSGPFSMPTTLPPYLSTAAQPRNHHRHEDRVSITPRHPSIPQVNSVCVICGAMFVILGRFGFMARSIGMVTAKSIKCTSSPTISHLS